MRAPWTPEDIAFYDQLIPQARAELKILRAALRIGTAETGEPQAMADMVAMLTADYTPAVVATMLMVTLLPAPAGEGTGETS